MIFAGLWVIGHEVPSQFSLTLPLPITDTVFSADMVHLHHRRTCVMSLGLFVPINLTGPTEVDE